MAVRMVDVALSKFEAAVTVGVLDIEAMTGETKGIIGTAVVPYWSVVAVESNSDMTPIEGEGFRVLLQFVWR